MAIQKRPKTSVIRASEGEGETPSKSKRTRGLAAQLKRRKSINKVRKSIKRKAIKRLDPNSVVRESEIKKGTPVRKKLTNNQKRAAKAKATSNVGRRGLRGLAGQLLKKRTKGKG